MLVTTEALASRLISFIETPGPPPLGFHWHVRTSVLQARLSLIPSLQGACPPAYQNSSLPRNFERGIRSAEEDEEAADEQEQGRRLWHSSPSFAVASFMLTHFKFVNLQVH